MFTLGVQQLQLAAEDTELATAMRCVCVCVLRQNGFHQRARFLHMF